MKKQKLNTLDEYFKVVNERMPKRKPPIWTPRCRFWDLKEKTPDELGQFGEQFVYSMLNDGLGNPYYVKWDNTTDSKEYDICVINQLTRFTVGLEVKTATQGDAAPTWQHENLEPGRGWDAMCFVDFAPNDLYITILTRDEIPFEEASDNALLPHTGPIHPRKNRDEVFKWTFSLGRSGGKRTSHNGVAMNRIDSPADFVKRYLEMEIRLKSQRDAKTHTTPVVDDTTVAPAPLVVA